MTQREIELAREVYRLLVNQGLELTVLQLAQKLNVNERSARDAVSNCSKIATQFGEVIGYEPESGLMMCAKTEQQSKNIMQHLYSRISDMRQRIDALNEALRKNYGERVSFEDLQGELFGRAV